MNRLLNIVTPLHTATRRDYLARMMDQKVQCMHKAKMYEAEYWDGDRRYGYGGYRYMPGRWKPVAEALIDIYSLKNGSKVLDIGCGKAFLLHELKLLLPDLVVMGCDISEHALSCAPQEIRPHLFIHRAQDVYSFGDKQFDLVISLGCFHNLRIFDLKTALSEMQRMGRQQYLMVESYRDEQELFNLQCWALTAESFFDAEEWVWLYEKFGYQGDYEFIYFE